MSEYVTVNCIEACPRCKHKIRMEYFDVSERNEYDMFELDCDYIKNIILNPYTECNGMFEPKEENK